MIRAIVMLAVRSTHLGKAVSFSFQPDGRGALNDSDGALEDWLNGKHKVMFDVY